MPHFFRSDGTPWNIDEDGFLRCRSTILRTGVLEYSRAELGAVPENLIGDIIRLYIPPESLCDKESLRTLEGKPIVEGHEWQQIENNSSVGNVAGTPIVDLPFLYCDILVTNGETRASVCRNNVSDIPITEISSAYDSTIDWTPGVTIDGESYDGIQRGLRYNHVALIPIGTGRAGGDVKILNKKGDSKVTDFTEVKIGNQTVRVHNEDSEKAKAGLEDIKPETKKAVLNQDETSDTEDKGIGSDMQKLLDVIRELTAAKSEAEGKLKALQDAMNPEAIEEQAEILNTDRETAKTLLNSVNVGMTDDFKKLRGHDLRLAVIDKVRLQNKASVLSERRDDVNYVQGMYAVTLENQAKSGKAPAGSDRIVNTDSSSQHVMNARGEQKTANQVQFGKLYPKKGAK